MACNKILFFSKNTAAALPYIKEAAAYLSSKGVECLCLDERAAFFAGIGIRPVSLAEAKQADFILSFGGDGTILKAARMFCDVQTPILGVNMGTVGYLTDSEPKDVVATLDKFLQGAYTIEKRNTLSITCNGKSYVGINEAVVYRNGVSHILSLRVSFDGQEIETLRADGLIVSTPTGSTAYNLSAGGPIVAPLSKTMLVTPICAHSLTSRPIVIGDDSVITVKAFDFRSEREKPSLDVDGKSVVRLNEGDVVEVKKGQEKVLLVRVNPTNFYKALKRKLGVAGGR